MKTIQSLYTLMAGAALVLCSCSADADQAQAPAAGAVELRLGSTVAADATTRGYDADNLLSGDTCYVWADMVNSTDGRQTPYFHAWQLEADGVGGLSPVPVSNKKLFPATNVLNFYALVGNFGSRTVTDPDTGAESSVPYITAEEDELPVTGIKHTVMADQRAAENYYKSDLLYAVRKGQEPVSQAVVLPFKHMLSRVQVVLVAANGLRPADLQNSTEGTTVTLLNLKRQVTFKPDSAQSFDDRAKLSAMLSTPAGVVTGDITMATQIVADAASATESAAYADAIVVPQTVQANQRLIRVDYLGRTAYYTLPSDFVFKSGSQYRFRILVDRVGTSYQLQTVNVEEWGANTVKPLWLEE